MPNEKVQPKATVQDLAAVFDSSKKWKFIRFLDIEPPIPRVDKNGKICLDQSPDFECPYCDKSNL